MRTTRFCGALLATLLLVASTRSTLGDTEEEKLPPPGSEANTGADALSLEARILGRDGQPVPKSRIAFWKACEEGSERRDSDWHDPVTQKTWRLVGGPYFCGDRYTQKGLAPGLYRVFACQGQGYGPPIGMSVPRVLDGSQKHTEVEVRLAAGSTVTLLPVDAETREPAPRPNIRLVNPSGTLPPDWKFLPPQSEATLKFHDVPPGNYSVYAELFPRRPDRNRYDLENGPLQTEVVAGRESTVVLPMRARPLTEAEIAQRWPKVTSGRVTDDQGQPLEGVTIRVCSGFGTLLETGITETDKDGRYTLRYLGCGSAEYCSEVFFAHKAGFAVKDPHARGDYVLVPALAIEAVLVDAQERPLARKGLNLSGDHLPPACNVLATGQTDAQGKVSFQDILPGSSCWFLTWNASRKEIRSEAITLPRPEKYRVRLRFREDAAQGDRLEVVSLTNAQGEELR